MFKKFFNRPKRERGVSRIQESMLIHCLKSDHGHYIPWLHTPWLHYFNLAAKPVARLVEDGYIVQDRHAGWYSITDKGIRYLWVSVGRQKGNAPVTFGQYEPYDWTTLFNMLRESDFVPVKVGP